MLSLIVPQSGLYIHENYLCKLHLILPVHCNTANSSLTSSKSSWIFRYKMLSPFQYLKKEQRPNPKWGSGVAPFTNFYLSYFRISQFRMPNAANSSFVISWKYDSIIREIPLCATNRYTVPSLSASFLISSSRL